jgi:hypothetical protein
MTIAGPKKASFKVVIVALCQITHSNHETEALPSADFMTVECTLSENGMFIVKANGIPAERSEDLYVCS